RGDSALIVSSSSFSITVKSEFKNEYIIFNFIAYSPSLSIPSDLFSIFHEKHTEQVLFLFRSNVYGSHSAAIRLEYNVFKACFFEHSC
ncbi:hypothetical protein CHH61_24095, partial [Shouchella clausii]